MESPRSNTLRNISQHSIHENISQHSIHGSLWAVRWGVVGCVGWGGVGWVGWGGVRWGGMGWDWVGWAGERMGPTPPPPAQWLIPQILVKPVAQVLAVASTASWSRREAKSTSQPAQSDKCHSAICHTLFACKSARIIIGSQSPLGGLGGLVGNPEIQATGSWARQV